MVNHKGIVTFRNTLARELYQTLGYVDDVLGQPYGNIRLVEGGEEIHCTTATASKKGHRERAGSSISAAFRSRRPMSSL